MKNFTYDIIYQKYLEAIEQGISEGEIVEYLSDNTDETIEHILDFIHNNR